MKQNRVLAIILAVLMAAMLSGCNVLTNILASKPTAATLTPSPAPALTPKATTAAPAPSASAGVITPGQFDGNAYLNEFFGMTLEMPEDWSIASREEMAQLYKASMDYLGATSKEAAEKAKLGEQKTVYGFYASKHPMGYTGGTNPNIQLMFENLGLAGFFVTSGKEYNEIAKKQMESAKLPYTFGDNKPITFGGKEFYELVANFTINGV